MTLAISALCLAVGGYLGIRFAEESARIDATLAEVLLDLPVRDWDAAAREEL